MNFSKRELVLALGTLAVVLFGLTFLIGEQKFKAWKEMGRQVELLGRKLQVAEAQVEQKGVLLDKLRVLQQQLPAHPLDRNVTSDLLRQLQSLADANQFKLRSVEPEKERKIGDLDLYELSISCNWEGELESLVKFLYALQDQGPVLDIRQMSAAPVPRVLGRLKGNFIVDCAYSRAAGEASARLEVTPVD